MPLSIVSPFKRPSLNDVRNYGEYATLFRWNVYFLDPPKAPQLEGFTEERFLNCLCESTDLPSKTVDKITVAIRGHRHYQPGIVTPNGTLTLNFVENVRNDASKVFYAWQQAIWAYNTGVGVPYDQLVADIAIERLDNSDSPVCTYVLRYCFMEGYTLPRLDGTTSGPFMVSMTLAFDDFYCYGTQIVAPENRGLAGYPSDIS